MKFLTLLALVVVGFAALAAAQWNRCPQGSHPPMCTGRRNVGTICDAAPPRRIWYYHRANRTCIAMQHLGCGGNSNRWCSRVTCEARCIRPGA